MKKLLFILPLAFLSNFLFAQVQHGPAMMSKGTNEAINLPLKQTNKKDVEAAWTKFIKDYKGKTKKDKKSGEIFSDDAKITDMSGNTVDVYSKVMERNEDTELLVWFDLGGAYLSKATHPDAFTVATKMLKEFELTVSTAALEEQIKEQEGVIKKMNNDLEGLKKDQTDAEAAIKKFEEKIEEAKAKIEASKTAQKTKADEIVGQKDVLNKLQTKLNAVK